MSEEIKEIEIGTAQKLELDEEYLVHIQANHLEFARFLKKIQDTIKDEDGKELSQRGIAQYLRNLGMKIKQPQVSRHLNVLTLPEKYIEMIEKKQMSFLAGHKLSRISDEEREKVYQIASAEAEFKAEEKGDETFVIKIYERHIEEVRRKTMSSGDIFKNLLKQEDFEEPYETAPEEETEEVKEVVMVEHSEPQVLVEGSELSNIIGMLKKRAIAHPDKKGHGRIKPTDLTMYVTQSKYVQNAIQAVSDVVKKELDKDSYKVH